MIESTRKVADFKIQDIRIYNASSLVTTEKLLVAIRKHWSVENSLHWTLDVILRED